ncbi:hypothetical protein CANCADRAFT_60803 [Tortispora caseinolytica NRRL Y-17796]|uniref:HTH APSES-type domain-containing protein n=1 Tax=Tortispora caseinolytica NRRL Y-17796 TaxID=767744 RepID=A0A1E4TFG4_9ASCO|nr:hypothetical protein CANCADRAFT_60803 [Tortispora caseinolytica NRRL Y-17796]
MAEVQIYKAIYSGVPVYEIMVNNVAVMRRRADGWCNATQILKIANFDKPQRTRILEREVQVGQHEKVQGGYGKYQGTWIPIDRSIELATKYKVFDAMKPILEYEPTAESPPLAPKHVSAAKREGSTRGRGRGRGRGGSTGSTRGGRKSSKSTPAPASSNFPSLVAAASMADSEIDSASVSSISSISEGENDPTRPFHFPPPAYGHSPRGPLSPRTDYANKLLDYFMTADDSSIPDFLLNPPKDFNINQVIDDEGHTAFHWACAMGHVNVMRVLINAGADIRATNNSGQTPLVRAIMFTNNYDWRTFPQVLDLLIETIFMLDRYRQNIFHHIATTTCLKSKGAAALYYSEVILTKFALIQSDQMTGSVQNMSSDALNLLQSQDLDGDTPLTIAARNGARPLVKCFLAYNCDPTIPNTQGHTAQDYITEHENNRRQLHATRNNYTRAQHGAYPDVVWPEISKSSSSPPMALLHKQHHLDENVNGSYDHQIGAPVPVPHLSETAIHASQEFLPTMAEHLEALAKAYDAELEDKEADYSQAQLLVESMKEEMAACEASIKDVLNWEKDSDEPKARNNSLETIKEQAEIPEGDASGANDSGRQNDNSNQNDSSSSQSTERINILVANASQVLETKSRAVEELMKTRSKQLRKLLERTQARDLAEIVQNEEMKMHDEIERAMTNGDKETQQGEREALVSELRALQEERQQSLGDIVELWSNAGVGEKMTDYRRLISLSCGVKPDDIDWLLDGIMQALSGETEELRF